MDGWRFDYRHLKPNQENLLRKLLIGLEPEQQEIMQSILDTFAKPKG